MTMKKSTLDEIRQRFDADVERFSELSIGQQAAPDSPVCMQWVADAALAITPAPGSVLDLGCGAGNYSLNLLKQVEDPSAVSVTLVDLSGPMLERAESRLREAGVGDVIPIQCDLLTLAREKRLPADAFDVVMSAAVLHHLREDDHWREVFEAVYQAVRAAPVLSSEAAPVSASASGGGGGGSWWVVDLILQTDPRIDRCMWDRYSDYLVAVKGEVSRDQAFAYIEAEDTPRPLVWQMKLMEQVGFECVDVLHKNASFAAFGGIKSSD